MRRLEENKSKASAIALGKCTPNVTNKLEGQPGYRKIKETRDILGLLKQIESNTKPYWALVMAKRGQTHSSKPKIVLIRNIEMILLLM